MQYQHIGYGIKGFYTLRSMVINQEYEMIKCVGERRYEILSFWSKHGLEPTMEAFKVSRRTLYQWRHRLDEGGGAVRSLNSCSRCPKKTRRRQWPRQIVQEIRRLRQVYKNLGKVKVHLLLKGFCQEHQLKCPSVSTIGRLIDDAPDKMRTMPEKIKPKTGQVVARKYKKVKRKPKGFKAKYPGHCVAFDTVEIRAFGRKCYIKTFTDIYSRFSLAYAYNRNTSETAKLFLEAVLKVFPAKIDNVLTDNGSEFKG